MLALLRAFARDDTGATAIEYALIAALVSVAGITALIRLGGSVDDAFAAVNGVLPDFTPQCVKVESNCKK